MSGRNVRRNLGLSPESELTPFFTQIYRNPQTFTQNPRTFYEIAQAKNNQNLQFTLNSVRKFLNAQENVRVKTELKQQVSYAVVARERKWQADLIDMQKFDGVTFLLTIIDIFTKYAIVIPLSNKSSITVSKAFFDLFSNMEESHYSLPLFLQTDNGPEFISKPLKKICDDKK